MFFTRNVSYPLIIFTTYFAISLDISRYNVIGIIIQKTAKGAVAFSNVSIKYLISQMIFANNHFHFGAKFSKINAGSQNNKNEQSLYGWGNKLKNYQQTISLHLNYATKSLGFWDASFQQSAWPSLNSID